MNLLKRWIAFYVFGNIHVSLAAYSLTKITFLQFNFQDQALANFVFFSTVFAYNMIRYFQIDRINTSVALWFRSNKRGLLVLNFISLCAAIYYLLQFDWQDFLFLTPFLMATVFYVLPNSSSGRGLRNIPGLKLFLIGLTWTGVTFFFPLFVNDVVLTDVAYLQGLQRFLFVLAITIPFDIRDISFDMEKLSTLPQALGLSASKVLATIVLVFYALLDVWIYGIDKLITGIDAILLCVTIVLVLFTTVHRNRYYTAFWIEGLPILWYVLYILFID